MLFTDNPQIGRETVTGMGSAMAGGKGKLAKTARNDYDYYPTEPAATRALLLAELVHIARHGMHFSEPCGRGGAIAREAGKFGLTSTANSAATQFKKGERHGVAVRLYKPIGTERFSKEGYLERKIHDGMPLQSRWRAVHLIKWEAINGPIPKGMCLKNIDGDRQNTEPSNWECISRSMLPRLAGGNGRTNYVHYDTAPTELKPTILAIAKVNQRAGAAGRKNLTDS